MENKTALLTLSLCVITLAGINLLNLTAGRVLGETTTAPVKLREMPAPVSNMAVEAQRSQPEIRPPEREILPERSVSCTTLTRFVAENCAPPKPTIIGPTITPPVTNCKTGLNTMASGPNCKLSNDLPGNTTARFECYDGYSGIVGKETGCYSRADLSAMAQSKCEGHSSCKPAPTLAPRPKN